MRLTLGIDSSTQGVKAVAWDVDAQKVVFSASVNYGRDLPQYGSPDGFLVPGAENLVRHADPCMWIEGLELVLAKLQATGCPMGDIAAIGGDAQQHATVYLSERGVEGLKGEKPTGPGLLERPRPSGWIRRRGRNVPRSTRSSGHGCKRIRVRQRSNASPVRRS